MAKTFPALTVSELTNLLFLIEALRCKNCPIGLDRCQDDAGNTECSILATRLQQQIVNLEAAMEPEPEIDQAKVESDEKAIWLKYFNDEYDTLALWEALGYRPSYQEMLQRESEYQTELELIEATLKEYS